MLTYIPVKLYAYTFNFNTLSVAGTTLTSSRLPSDASKVSLYRDDALMATSTGVYKTFDTYDESGVISDSDTKTVGSSVALYENTMAVAAMYDVDDAGGNIGTGAALVYTYDSGTWTKITKLRSSDGGVQNFGTTIAIHKDTIVVGARSADSSKGAAYVFTRDVPGSLASGWTQRAKLVASDGAASDQFSSVSISGDTIVVGASHDDDKGTNSGSAYVFARDVPGSLTSGWTEQAKLVPSDGTDDNVFGWSVSVSGDIAVISAPRVASSAGAVYVFTRDVPESLASGWTQRAKLVASDGAANNYFGWSVSIDGDVIAVGTDNVSRAYAFTPTVSGVYTSWTETKIHATFGTELSGSGRGVGVYGNHVLVVGAGKWNLFSIDGALTRVDGNSVADSSAGNGFNYTTAQTASINDNHFVLGSYVNASADNPGQVYAYTASNVAVDFSIGMSGTYHTRSENADGKLVGISAPYTATPSSIDFVSISETTKLLAADGTAYDLFGGSVSISGDTAVVGASADDGSLGSVHVYVLTRVGLIRKK